MTAGQDCPQCGERARSMYTAHDDDGRVVRQRMCPDGHRFSTVEVPVSVSFHRMASDRRDNKRDKRRLTTSARSYRPVNPIVVRFRSWYGAVETTVGGDLELPRTGGLTDRDEPVMVGD